jgi:hypothetical protein
MSDTSTPTLADEYTRARDRLEVLEEDYPDFDRRETLAHMDGQLCVIHTLLGTVPDEPLADILVDLHQWLDELEA